MIKLIDILNEVVFSSVKFPLPFKNGGINLTGEAAWNKWKQWASINKKDQYIYNVLDTIKNQNYHTTQKQLEILLKWFNGVRESLLENKSKPDRCMRIARRKFAKSSAYRSGAIVRCRQGKIWKDIKESEIDTLQEATLEEKETLRTWFKRKGAPGKEGGWVDCNTCRDGKCKPCGRKKGETRAKYPSCQPTPAKCKRPGKGKTWGKTK